MHKALCLVAVLAVPGCMTAGSDQLRTRAAFDMQCPEERVQLVGLDLHSRGVVGCGRHATYVSVCGGCTCAWLCDTTGGILVPGGAVAADGGGYGPDGGVCVALP